VKSGISIVKKVVMHVDNTHADCTVDNLTSFLVENNIEVLSCYSAKSWMREAEKSMVAAFRVCIAARCKDTFCDPVLWPRDVIVREWIFKGKQDGAHN
jgi:hypothetical protein